MQHLPERDPIVDVHVLLARSADIIVTLSAPAVARTIIERYRSERAQPTSNSLPIMGIARHVVVAETEAAAVSVAERAYKPWLKHMELLWTAHGLKLPLGLPPEIGPLLQIGTAFAGTATGLRNFVDGQAKATGANYFVCDVAFGDVSLKEAMRTVDLLAREVIPFFAEMQG
jgi:alkanesulfonate monooxygenase SsuD/methylene tetrahydromethanopterin reductase-like flavin-dependent oxidoreductase (luciferase family)